MRYIDLSPLEAKKSKWSKGRKGADGADGVYEKWRGTRLRTDFISLAGNKCWYSESEMIGSSFHMDHFRPKNEVKELPDYDYNTPLANTGYHWLANEYTNYRVSCAWSNSGQGTSGKSSYFPLLSDTYLTQNGTEEELPALLDPCVKVDVQLLTFYEGNVTPRDPNCTINCLRAEASRRVYNLDHTDFKQKRNNIWSEVEMLFKDYERNRDIIPLQRKLKTLVDKKSAYSACAISAVRIFSADLEDLLEELALDLEL